MCSGMAEVEESVADANRSGAVTRRLVRASGRENQEVEAAGMLLNDGWYTGLFMSAGRLRSDSPLGLLFITGDEWLYR